MPHLQKSAVMRDFLPTVPPWVNSLHTLPADSFGNIACSTNRRGLSYTQPIAASHLLPTPVLVLATLAKQLDKTAAKL